MKMYFFNTVTNYRTQQT